MSKKGEQFTYGIFGGDILGMFGPLRQYMYMMLYRYIYNIIYIYIYTYIYMSCFKKSPATVLLFFRFEILTSQQLPVYFWGCRKTNVAISNTFDTFDY